MGFCSPFELGSGEVEDASASSTCFNPLWIDCSFEALGGPCSTPSKLFVRLNRLLVSSCRFPCVW
ncbi:MAG: hypothetical protein II818_01605 [Aeriscardovia sp.]|nr:hypothetical protein [Aeriscardovia sp.]